MACMNFLGKEYEVPEGYIGISTRAVSPDLPNLNGDLFPLSELKKAASQYEGLDKVFVDHATDEEGVDRVFSRGFVKAAGFDSTNCLCLLIMVSKEFPALISSLESGGINSVSMGCEAEAECGICGSTTGCRHMAFLGMNTNEGYVFDILSKIEFEEISFVFDPADPTALIWEVFDPDPNL